MLDREAIASRAAQLLVAGLVLGSVAAAFIAFDVPVVGWTAAVLAGFAIQGAVVGWVLTAQERLD